MALFVFDLSPKILVGFCSHRGVLAGHVTGFIPASAAIPARAFGEGVA